MQQDWIDDKRTSPKAAIGYLGIEDDLKQGTYKTSATHNTDLHPKRKMSAKLVYAEMGGKRVALKPFFYLWCRRTRLLYIHQTPGHHVEDALRSAASYDISTEMSRGKREDRIRAASVNKRLLLHGDGPSHRDIVLHSRR